MGLNVMPGITDAFLLFALVATLSPGGATTLATASGIRHGYRRSIPLILGIAAGLAMLAAAGALGVGVFIMTFPALDLTIRAIGSAYLLWLVVKIWSAGPPAQDGLEAAAPFGFPSGLLLTLLNPKGWAMTMAAAVTFAPIAPDPAALAMIMAFTFASAAVLSLSVWCLGGVAVSRRISSPGQWRFANRTLAVLLAGCIAPLWIG